MFQKISKDKIKEIVAGASGEIKATDQDEMAVPTYLHKNPLIRWLFWKRHEEIIDFAKLNKQKTVLDYGCGIGILLPTLSASAKEVFATDIFPQFAKKITESMFLNNVSFFISEQIDAEIQDDSIDVIIAADVMEHLDDPRTISQVFLKKLKKGGMLIVSGPTENKLYKLGRKIAGFDKKGEYHHFNIFDLDKIIREVGFKKESRKRLPFFFTPSLFEVIKYVR